MAHMSTHSRTDWFSNRPPALTQNAVRFPQWLRRPIPQQEGLGSTQEILENLKLNTVCEEAKCPNRLECHTAGTATFLAMGKSCTRNCGFCAIDHQVVPEPLEVDEPDRIAKAVLRLGLKHAVITMVARDDLPDQGAQHLVQIIRAIKKCTRQVTIEVLTSDFEGKFSNLETVLEAEPDLFNHNVETIARLTPRVRHKATYERSLALLSHARNYSQKLLVKSGIMVGLGEIKEEVFQTLRDLHAVGCNSITIGQYLQPSHRKLRVKRFVTPEEFQEYRQYGLSLGIQQMFCGPFVRSSYHAGEEYHSVLLMREPSTPPNHSCIN